MSIILFLMQEMGFSKLIGMYIYGQVGTKAILDMLINTPFTVPLSTMQFKVEIHELSEGIHNIPFQLEYRFMLHSAECFLRAGSAI